MAFTRKAQNTFFAYSILGEPLSRVCAMKDLGVMFYPSLRFARHITRLVNSSLRTLDVASRLARDFKHPSAFLTLYRSLCMPQLEYASVVWNGISKSNSLEIERVQKKFISIFKHRYPIKDVHCSTYDAALERVDLLSLHRRRQKADLLFFLRRCMDRLIHQASCLKCALGFHVCLLGINYPFIFPKNLVF